MHRLTTLHALFPGQRILQISLFANIESLNLEAVSSGLLRKNQYLTPTNKLNWSIRAQLIRLTSLQDVSKIFAQYPVCLLDIESVDLV